MRRPPKLPRARLISDEPTEAQVRWTVRATWLMFVVFFVVFVIGNHVPKT
ncbi:MAG: hypothetical protein SFX73_12395 [Kofleriaceae bacterium]|nr:hypothetical protein [Kofleriaceae bacterium]